MSSSEWQERRRKPMGGAWGRRRHMEKKRLNHLTWVTQWAWSPTGGLMATSAGWAVAVCWVLIGQSGLSSCQEVILKGVGEGGLRLGLNQWRWGVERLVQKTYTCAHKHTVTKIDVAVGHWAEPSPLTGCLNISIVIEWAVLFSVPHRQSMSLHSTRLQYSVKWACTVSTLLSFTPYC